MNVDLETNQFDSEDYKRLRDNISANKNTLPVLCVSEKYVYKRTTFATADALEDDMAWKLWVPQALQTALVHAAHFSPSSGHGGVHKTLERLREKYYWPRMVKHVQQVVKRCNVCSANKTTNAFKKPVMGKQMVTERPFQRVFVDFMGPYPRSKDGN